MRKLVPAVLGALAIASSLPASSYATSIPGPPGKIAFTSGRPTDGLDPANPNNDQGARIWVADYPGGTPVKVTTEPPGEKVRHRQPNWSPDHTRIAYAADPGGTDYGIWILDLRDGSQT